MRAQAEAKKPKRPRKIAVTALLCVAAVLAVAGVCAAFGVLPHVTQVVCDGESKTVFSLTNDPQAIVAKANVTLGDFDRINLDGFDEAEWKNSLAVERRSAANPAAPLVSFVTSDRLQTVAKALAEQGRALRLQQKVKVRLLCDGKKQTVKTSGTVADALHAAKITLGENDAVNHPLSAALEDGMSIRVQRVRYREATKKKAIPFSTEELPNDTLYVGETQLLQEGQAGERTVYYLEKTVDGEPEGRLKIGESVTKEPLPELLFIGTKTGLIPQGSVGVSGLADRAAISELPATLDIAVDVYGKPVNYKKLIVGEATAYSGGGVTSTGKSAMPGRVAVDPREIPYGSKLFIVSTDGNYIYGYAEAADTGGFIHNSDTAVDLYMHRESDCEAFGRRNVEIYVLE